MDFSTLGLFNNIVPTPPSVSSNMSSVIELISLEINCLEIRGFKLTNDLTSFNSILSVKNSRLDYYVNINHSGLPPPFPSLLSIL